MFRLRRVSHPAAAYRLAKSSQDLAIPRIQSKLKTRSISSSLRTSAKRVVRRGQTRGTAAPDLKRRTDPRPRAQTFTQDFRLLLPPTPSPFLHEGLFPTRFDHTFCYRIQTRCLSAAAHALEKCAALELSSRYHLTSRQEISSVASKVAPAPSLRHGRQLYPPDSRTSGAGSDTATDAATLRAVAASAGPERARQHHRQPDLPVVWLRRAMRYC